MITEKVVYRTPDGKQFDVKVEAEEHDKVLALAEWLSVAADLASCIDRDVDWLRVAVALRKNPEVVG